MSAHLTEEGRRILEERMNAAVPTGAAPLPEDETSRIWDLVTAMVEAIGDCEGVPMTDRKAAGLVGKSAAVGMKLHKEISTLCDALTTARSTISARDEEIEKLREDERRMDWLCENRGFKGNGEYDFRACVDYMMNNRSRL